MFSEIITKRDKLRIEDARIQRIFKANEKQDKPVFLFCRRIPKEHICLCNNGYSALKSYIKTDKMVVISDVYEYFVAETIDRIELEIPVYKKATKYDIVMVIDSFGRSYKVSQIGVSMLLRTIDCIVL